MLWCFWGTRFLRHHTVLLRTSIQEISVLKILNFLCYFYLFSTLSFRVYVFFNWCNINTFIHIHLYTVTLFLLYCNPINIIHEIHRFSNFNLWGFIFFSVLGVLNLSFRIVVIFTENGRWVLGKELYRISRMHLWVWQRLIIVQSNRHTLGQVGI